MAHYLELVPGVSRVAARQRVRVARALAAEAEEEDPTADDFERAYAATPQDERRGTWGRGLEWEVREGRVPYGVGAIPRDRRADTSTAVREASGRRGRRVPQPALTTRKVFADRLAGGRGLFEPAGACSLSATPEDYATRELGSATSELTAIPRDRAGYAAPAADSLRSSRAITRRWISDVPSPIVQSFTSRKNFSTGKSLV
jgi:hypothetical protein